MSNENEMLLRPMDLWVTEYHKEHTSMGFRISKTLYSGKSDFQQVDVVETVALGKMLLNDGAVMLTEADEYIYHDMIAHIPLFVHPNPKRVLVIGGGDGGTIREVLRHPEVEYARLVEIDPLVLEACEKHIPLTSAALKDARVEVSVADGVKFMAETDEKYDVILIDSTDPVGPATPLFGTEFYKNVHRVLTEDGIVISQGESVFRETDMQRTLLGILKSQFERVHIYNYCNQSYPAGFWSFTYASKGLCPWKDFSPERVAKSGLEFQYYNAAIHKASFCLPEMMKRALNEFLSPLPVDQL